MKSTFVLGAFAALCSEAIAFTSGKYTIGTEVHSPLLLSVGQDGKTLTFSNAPKFAQVWQFQESTTQSGFFDVYNSVGGSPRAYIDCGETPGTICVADDVPVSYRPEYLGGTSYELVSNITGYFLHSQEDNTLELAEWDYNSPKQAFNLTLV